MDEDVGVMWHKTFAMQSDNLAKNSILPLEMGLFTATPLLLL